jgi:hypothetical protein
MCGAGRDGAALRGRPRRVLARETWLPTANSPSTSLPCGDELLRAHRTEGYRLVATSRGVVLVEQAA